MCLALGTNEFMIYRPAGQRVADHIAAHRVRTWAPATTYRYPTRAERPFLLHRPC